MQPGAFTGEGVAMNSAFLDGLTTPEAKRRITTWLEERELGRKAVAYKLRDWLFSRQRYWGEPFPIVWESGKHRALEPSELPVVQPDLSDFHPTGTPEPPLQKAREWVRYSEGAIRETNTMPQWAGSCWYYLRFCDPQNPDRFASPQAEAYWMGGAASSNRTHTATQEGAATGGVDLYVGGTEHAVLHLLYARFWHKVLFDLGHVSTREPFRRLVNQGIILGPDNQKMSKSRGNVVNPEAVIEEFGADSLRLYEMFIGPLEQVKPWSIKGVEGVYRFLARVWRLAMQEQQDGSWALADDLSETPLTASQLRLSHATIKKVTHDLESLSFNTAISQLMIFTNEFVNASPRPVEALRVLLPLLSPLAPHLTEELWETLAGRFSGFPGAAASQPWPRYDESLLAVDEVDYAIQINGKTRDRMRIRKDAGERMLQEAALALPRIETLLKGATIRKVIVVPNKLLNFVATEPAQKIA